MKMLKYLKKNCFIALSLMLLGTSLVGCGKEGKDNKDNKDNKESLGNIFNTSSVETTEVTEATETTEDVFEITIETTTEEITVATTEEKEDKEEKASYIVTSEVDTTTIPGIAVEGSESNPMKQGEWTQALKSAGTSNPKQTLYFRITDVARGEDAMSIIKDYEENGGYFEFGDLEYDDLEYCVATYQVYFPDDYVQEDFGISFSNLAFHVVDGDNHGTINNYIGMAQTYDISDYVKINTLYPGDVLERQVVFVMVKDYTDYMLYYRYYDDNYTEYTKYVACEKISEVLSVSESASSSSIATPTTETSSASVPGENNEITTDDIANKTNTITNGVYIVTGVQYADGTYASKEQLEEYSGQPFDVYFTVMGDTVLFDASAAGDGFGRTAGTIEQHGENFTFTDSSGNTFECTWDSSTETITMDFNGKNMIFEPYE